MFAEAKKVHGKTAKLYSIAEASLRRPDESVRKVVFPAVGEGTLRALVAEAKADAKAYKQGAGAHGADLLIFLLLPADAAQAAGRDRVQVQQHRLPAGDGRFGSARF
jgi:hypothetical protein